MGLLETLSSFTGAGIMKKGVDLAKSFFGSATQNPILKSFAGNPEAEKKAEKIRETAEKERGSIFGEVWESYLAREMPWLDKSASLAGWVGIIEEDPEAWSGQRWFERITAFTMVVPDFMLKYVTEPIRSSSVFQKIVEHWPLLGSWEPGLISERGKWKDIIKDPNCDPDDVVNILRIMQQDVSLGVVSWEKISSLIGFEGGIMNKLKSMLT